MTTTPAPTTETLFLASETLLALDEAVGQQVAQFVADGMSEADATDRALAALLAQGETLRAEQEFLASLTVGED